MYVRAATFFSRINILSQAATAAVPPGAGPLPPQEGDGFTFEHLAERDTIWLDFVADIGDGGDSTYAVASCMAAPTLLATDSAATAKAETRNGNSLSNSKYAVLNILNSLCKLLG